MPRVTSTNTAQSQRATYDYAMLSQSLNGEGRATRVEATPASDPWTDEILVAANEKNQR
jgi:hypothetical protein